MSDANEAQVLERFRWWNASELVQTEERLTPLALAAIVSGYLKHGPLEASLEVEVLED